MDTVLRIIEKNGVFRAFVADTTELVNKATKIHGFSPVCAAAMGRTLTAACMMGFDLKSDNESLSIQIDGDGPIGNIVTVSDSHGRCTEHIRAGGIYGHSNGAALKLAHVQDGCAGPRIAAGDHAQRVSGCAGCVAAQARHFARDREAVRRAARLNNSAVHRFRALQPQVDILCGKRT